MAARGELRAVQRDGRFLVYYVLRIAHLAGLVDVVQIELHRAGERVLIAGVGLGHVGGQGDGIAIGDAACGRGERDRDRALVVDGEGRGIGFIIVVAVSGVFG